MPLEVLRALAKKKGLKLTRRRLEALWEKAKRRANHARGWYAAKGRSYSYYALVMDFFKEELNELAKQKRKRR